MAALESGLRKQLERTVIKAREIAEDGARAALQTLAVSQPDAYATMTPEQRAQRTALRAKAKNLGEGSREQGIAPLIEEIAYEQWHRLLFARFLAENRLLMHPLGGHLSIDECTELAPSEGADNGWDLAGRYTALMLPGIFRADDPAAQVRLAREYRSQLEALVADLSEDVFTSDDGLGWTYQFWQAKKKDEVNKAGHKIGARELAPVTQLFTEDYMVRFLLENSLGAWWAARHPESPLIKDMDYLRLGEDGTPAAGTFPGWPERAAEVTAMDPCCGSGHFLVRAFHLLRRMRMEEEGFDTAGAGDAVLRDNLFGLELDERCVQIACFALALEAWKSGGHRPIPVPQIACSGTPVGGQLEDWLIIAGDDEILRDTLAELHRLFRDAPILGSLIDPRTVVRQRGLFAPNWNRIQEALRTEEIRDKKNGSVPNAVGEVVQAANLLSRSYSLVATNPPFLHRGKQNPTLMSFSDKHHASTKSDLATAFMERCMSFVQERGTVASVSPHAWLFLGSYREMREYWIRNIKWLVTGYLGTRAFESISGEVVSALIGIFSKESPERSHAFAFIDATTGGQAQEKDRLLREHPPMPVLQVSQLANPEHRITFTKPDQSRLLGEYAQGLHGQGTFDDRCFILRFWELGSISGGWIRQQSTGNSDQQYSGATNILRWENGAGLLRQLIDDMAEAGYSSGKWKAGLAAWGRRGVAIGGMGELHAHPYLGTSFNLNLSVVLPRKDEHFPAIWCYCSSEEYIQNVRRIDRKQKVTSNTFVKVPFDLERWQKVADETGPLPEPHSNDPTQWLFKGHPNDSTAPLQVSVARLLGYRWPEQPETDGLEVHGDADGLVALSSLRGETSAPERLRALLASAYGEKWSHGVQEHLLVEAGFAGRDLGAWLGDSKGFFAQHTKLFHNRPFIWQIWDGSRDGFSVLVNYHKLTSAALDRLIYSYLGDWIARQERSRKAGEPGAEDRLIKARVLKDKLEAIRDGEPPYDIYVRWKPLHEQPIGWDPDLNDGVRVNIRPFVEAGILRSKFSINWNKDRGDNPLGSTARQYAAEAQQAAVNAGELSSTDGRERLNDLHLTRAVKEAARARVREMAAT
jgi:hypothetical protein